MIMNLTQHAATKEQKKAGVVEPRDKAMVQGTLTFDELPSQMELEQKAKYLAAVARDGGADSAMLEGPPYLMAPLVNALKNNGVKPLFAFSVSDSTEEVRPDGSVKKSSVFRHRGFVEG